jgi:hypothetical protein
VGGWAQVLELLAGEDVDGDEMDLGVAVLARLGGGHFDNLAWTVLDHDEAVLAQSRALHRVRGRGASVGALEGVALMLRLSAMSCSRRRDRRGKRHGLMIFFAETVVHDAGRPHSCSGPDTYVPERRRPWSRWGAVLLGMKVMDGVEERE